MEDIVGFGFRPKDDEVVGYYLHNKILGYETSRIDRAIKVVKICDYDPWDLRFESKIESKDLEWYFFSCIEKKYAIGNRQNRKTISGKWKLTGEAVEVKDQLGIWCRTLIRVELRYG
ncbi:NAC domain-containing protein 1 [Cardamine amara subsp. amara]|uniref:NAC domain-containing protein 1 n=1 Tax=Cardamine amara subsp. amara TaxID=228776 RepID=A0ABD1A4P2_CARAN